MNPCAITGMGLVSCLGIGVEKTFLSLAHGRSGVGLLTSFDSTGFKPIHVGEVGPDRLREAAGSLLISPDRIRHRKALLIALAISEAWRDSSPADAPNPLESDRVAVVLGNGLIFGPEPIDWIFEGKSTVDISKPRLSREDLTAVVEGDGSLECLAEVAGARGIQLELNSACAASGHALGVGMMLIRHGHADLVVVAGVDAMLNPVGVGGFQRLGVTSTRAIESFNACKPFDQRRDGTIIGEGAAVLILESADRMTGRPSWGYLEGAGFSADGFSVTAPHPDGAGAARAMRAALRSADRSPGDIEYLNAHGTGTRLNDMAEIDAIREVFGPDAGRVAISSTKPYTGHLIAAAGVFEAAITLLTINSGIIFATLNQLRPDPPTGLDFVAMNSRRQGVRRAMSNSFGLGGQTSCVVLGAPTSPRALPTVQAPVTRPRPPVTGGDGAIPR